MKKILNRRVRTLLNLIGRICGNVLLLSMMLAGCAPQRNSKLTLPEYRSSAVLLGAVGKNADVKSTLANERLRATTAAVLSAARMNCFGDDLNDAVVSNMLKIVRLQANTPEESTSIILTVIATDPFIAKGYADSWVLTFTNTVPKSSEIQYTLAGSPVLPFAPTKPRTMKSQE